MSITDYDFIQYISLLKVIRGIISVQNKPTDNVFRWLRRSIRWRPVGCCSQMIKQLKKYGFSSKLIKPVVLPFESMKSLVKLLAKAGLEPSLALSVVLSSSYIVPMIILDDQVLGNLRDANLVSYDVLSNKKLGDRDIKTHLRIAEYSTKDYHFEVIQRAERAIENNQLEDEIKWRRKLCQKDAKRYWRIKQNRGKVMIVYIDILRGLSEFHGELLDIIKSHREVILGLGIPVGIIVYNMLEE